MSLFSYHEILNCVWQAKDDEIEYLRSEIKRLINDLEEARKSLSEKNQHAEDREKDLEIAKQTATTAREHQKEAQRFKVLITYFQILKYF